MFPPLASYLIDIYGWQNCLRIFSALHLVCSGLSLTYMPITSSIEDKVPLSMQNVTKEKWLEMPLRVGNEDNHNTLTQYGFGCVISN